MNIVPFPSQNLLDIPAMLRGLADAIEEGEYGEITTAMVLLDGPDALQTELFGESLSRYGAAGMLAFAQQQAVLDD